MNVQLLGGPTKIEVNLSGFNDTKKHGLHVHTFNSTENQCRDCGPIFDPDPTDGERFVCYRDAGIMRKKLGNYAHRFYALSFR